MDRNSPCRVAYFPQILHLWVEKCAWGLSLWTWLIWLVSSAFLLVYSWASGNALFVIVQCISILAITLTIVLAKRSDRFCSYHSELSMSKGVGE